MVACHQSILMNEWKEHVYHFFTIVEISTKIVYWRELISSLSEMTDCLFTVGWYATHHCMVIDDLKNVVEFWSISSKICSVTVCSN